MQHLSHGFLELQVATNLFSGLTRKKHSKFLPSILSRMIHQQRHLGIWKKHLPLDDVCACLCNVCPHPYNQCNIYDFNRIFFWIIHQTESGEPESPAKLTYQVISSRDLFLSPIWRSRFAIESVTYITIPCLTKQTRFYRYQKNTWANLQSEVGILRPHKWFSIWATKAKARPSFPWNTWLFNRDSYNGLW